MLLGCAVTETVVECLCVCVFVCLFVCCCGTQTAMQPGRICHMGQGRKGGGLQNSTWSVGLEVLSLENACFDERKQKVLSCLCMVLGH